MPNWYYWYSFTNYVTDARFNVNYPLVIQFVIISESSFNSQNPVSNVLY